ncbi:unnamed protein product [Ranitomeya imitator]|uniref:Uncharacterized protein n=1 Tax=Ranitomeya imitator TaxID=111125 RepID=A0ABN9KVD3_9NEOB|nr:unnamed protein product [Ranitomeya imitator]
MGVRLIMRIYLFGVLQPPPLKPPPPMSTHMSFPPAPLDVPMNVPGVSNVYPQALVPPAYHPATRPGINQPPTPPTMTASHVPFSYPTDMGFREGGPGAPTVVPPPPTAGEQEGWIDSFSMKSSMQRKKPNPTIPPAPITTPVMKLPSEPEILQPYPSSNLDPIQTPPGAPKEVSMQVYRNI